MTTGAEMLRAAVQRAVETTAKRIESRGDKFCVVSESTGRNFGCYDTKEEAQRRLGQIEAYKRAPLVPVAKDDGTIDLTPWDGTLSELVAVLERGDRVKAPEQVPREVRLVARIRKDDPTPEAAEPEKPAAERYVFGVVLMPNRPDSQGDTYDEAEVRAAAHRFMEFYDGKLGLMHSGLLDGKAVLLETYVSRHEETYGDETFPVGTWFMGCRITDDVIWQQVETGKLTGFSIGGTARRVPLKEPESTESADAA